MPTQPKTTLLAIRHGETVWNEEKRYQGHGDSALTEAGRNQVAALGRRMKKIQIRLPDQQRFGASTGNGIDNCRSHGSFGGN